MPDEQHPRVIVLLSLADEPESGPGSALAKLRWHLAQAGLDGEVAGDPAAAEAGPLAKGLGEIAAQTPAALAYLAGATALSALAKVAGEWARSRGKRAKLSVKRPNGTLESVELWNLDPDQLAKLVRELHDPTEG